MSFKISPQNSVNPNFFKDYLKGGQKFRKKIFSPISTNKLKMLKLTGGGCGTLQLEELDLRVVVVAFC